MGSYFINFEKREANKKKLTSLIADLLLLKTIMIYEPELKAINVFYFKRVLLFPFYKYYNCEVNVQI